MANLSTSGQLSKGWETRTKKSCPNSTVWGETGVLRGFGKGWRTWEMGLEIPTLRPQSDFGASAKLLENWSRRCFHDLEDAQVSEETGGQPTALVRRIGVEVADAA